MKEGLWKSISSSEKLLMLLLLITIFMGIFFDIYMPCIEKRKDKIKSNIELSKKKIERIKSFHNGVLTEVPVKYTDRTNNENIAYSLNQMADKSGMKLTGINFGNTESSGIAEEGGRIKYSFVSFTAMLIGEEADLFKFIKALKDQNLLFYIISIEINGSDSVSCTLRGRYYIRTKDK